MRSLRQRLNRGAAKVVSAVLLCLLSVVSSDAQGLNAGSQISDSTATVKKQKSPKGAMLRTLAIPGWGQLYNEQYIKAGLVFTVRSVLIGLAVHYQIQVNASTSAADRDFYKTRRNDAIVFYGIATLLSMIDAYIDAHLYDFDVGPELEIKLGVLPSKIPQTGLGGLGLSLRKHF